MKLFLSVPFSSRVNENGIVFVEFRAPMEQLIANLRRQGHEVFCSLEYADWQIDGVALPEDEFKRDLAEIDNCDQLIVLLEERVSAGVQLENGYAFAKGKTVAVYQIGRPAWSNIAFSRLNGHDIIPVQSVDDFAKQVLNAQ